MSSVDNRGRERPRIGRCRDCHAPMLWATTPQGVRNPLDPMSTTEYGDHLLICDRQGVRVVVKIPDRDTRQQMHGIGIRSFYTSHFDTCPKRQRRDY